MAEDATGRMWFVGGTNILRGDAGGLSQVPLPEFSASFRGPLQVLGNPAGEIWLSSASHVWLWKDGCLLPRLFLWELPL